MEGATATFEEDNASSYGTGGSEDEEFAMDMQTENPGEGWMKGLDKIKHSIDALHSN